MSEFAEPVAERRLPAGLVEPGESEARVASGNASTGAARILRAAPIAGLAVSRPVPPPPGGGVQNRSIACARPADPFQRLGALRRSCEARVLRATDAADVGPEPPDYLKGMGARHVTGNIWEVDFGEAGPHYVGPYQELVDFTKTPEAGLSGKVEVHHIVGGEHLRDLEIPYSYANAPAIAIDAKIHRRSFTPQIGDGQHSLGGRQGGRAVVSASEVEEVYEDVYGGGEFAELTTVSRRILSLSKIGGAVGVVTALYEPIAAAQQIDETTAQVGKTMFGKTGQQLAELSNANLVPISNEIHGQTFMFDPKRSGPAKLYRVVTDPQEAFKLKVVPGGLVEVGELYWIEDEQRWSNSDLSAVDPPSFWERLTGSTSRSAWIARYPERGNVYALNISED